MTTCQQIDALSTNIKVIMDLVILVSMDPLKFVT
jgi:hypothetical protein